MASNIHSNNGTVAGTNNSETQTVTAATAVGDSASKTEALETETELASENPYATESATADGTSSTENKWPGWPGECVFRLIVPVVKVGSIIGRKGDIIKKMCEETKSRIRVLEAPVGTPDRIVLIHSKEETELALSPAMNAVIQVFKRINEYPENEGENVSSVTFCSIRLLVRSIHATSLIGKQGASIKSIQDSTGCAVRVLSCDQVLSAKSDEWIVDMQGESIKVLKALEAVLRHLRKFLVDRSVLPLFEMTNNVAAASQEHQMESPWADTPMMRAASGSQSQHGLGGGGDYSLQMRREILLADREPLQRESHLTSNGLSLYRRDPMALSPAIARTGGPIVTQVAQTMQIPLVYVEDIIGVGGTNIAYIRRTSGAILTVQESRGDEFTVEIKGTASQVQIAQQLIQECVYGHQESSIPSGYGKLESGLRSSYSQLENSSYPPSSLSSSAAAAAYGGESYDRYGTSGLGGYSSSYRL